MTTTPSSSATMDYGQAGLPLLPLDDGPPDFDYGVFLQDNMQEDDADYLAEESSASTSTNTITDAALQALSPQGSAVIRGGATPKQRLERRGHTKSRRGCFNCKRRRIKVGFVPSPFLREGLLMY